MADTAPTPEQEKAAADKFKSLINEVLDERQVKADAAQADADKAAADEEASRRTREPLSVMRSFLGF